MNPHPLRDVSEVVLATGDPVTIRPIRPDDEPMMVRFHEGLSDLSVSLRYFHVLGLAQRTAHERLARICGADGDREIVIVAEGRERERGAPAILGVARLERGAVPGHAEFAVLVADSVQGIGVGSGLMTRIIQLARASGCSHLRADVLAANAAMRRLCARVGIPIMPTDDPHVVSAELDL
jgi:acetyltransferase